MRRPLVTVLTPTLDAEEFLRPMLASLRGQTLDADAIEHLIVDGGSRDGTTTLVRELAPRSRVISAPGSGIYAAMNLGLQEARGLCIGWLNADDLWHDDALSTVARAFAARPSTELVIGDYEMFDGAERWHYRVRVDALERIRTGRMRRWFDIWVNPLAAFFRTDVLRDLGGYDPALRLVADWDLWFRAASRSPPLQVVHAGTQLGRFRVHPGSLTSGLRIDRLLEEKRVVCSRWADDPGAPRALRECARRMFRHDTLALWALRARSAPTDVVPTTLDLGAALRDAGPGLVGDVTTGAVIALHELARSVPGLGVLARAAWAATGGPSVSSSPGARRV